MCTDGGWMMINNFRSIQENKFIFVNVSFSHNQALNGGGLFNVVACRENLNIINTTFNENSGFVGAGVLFYPKLDWEMPTTGSTNKCNVKKEYKTFYQNNENIPS